MPEEKEKILQMFSAAVRRRRHSLAHTQMEIAERMDCNLNTYARIERGQADPSLTTVVRVAKALEISAKDLLP